MWAQILKTRMKQGVESELNEMQSQLKERVSGRPGLVRAFWMQSQNDSQEYYTVIVFESEELARQGERQLDNDPFFQRLRELGEGTPEYVDLNVVETFP